MALRVAVAILAALLASPGPLRAQGFFERYFANGPPPRLYGYRAVRPNPYVGAQPFRSLYAWPPPQEPNPNQPEGGSDGAPYGPAGTYRTLCVRLCDGYYFPISSATTGAGLSHDADRCSASCGTEARLFYHANAGGGVDSMVDLTGMAYSALPNAYKYRKALVEGCSCRPPPWSQAELRRHRGYAQGRPVAPEAPAKTASKARAAAEDGGTLAQPAPIDRALLERPGPSP